MKKRFLAAITAFAVLFTSGCGERSDTSTPSDYQSVSSESGQFEVTPPFFKVTDESTSGVVYMMGSMHVGKPGATYPQRMYDALEECDALAVEVDIVALEDDVPRRLEAQNMLLCTDGRNAADYMGDDYRIVVAKFTELDLYDPIYEMYIPSVWSSLWMNKMVMKCGFDADLGTDRVLLRYAAEHDMRIEEIESVQEQYAVEASASPELQTYTLRQTLDLNEVAAKAQYNMLYNAWSTADMETLKQLSEAEIDDSVSEELADEYDAYYHAMYTKRQEKMARYVQSQLAAGNKTFVVVGAMHYAAPPDILDFLAESGRYTITPIDGKWEAET